MAFQFTEAQEAWLQALESGEYEQGIKQLANGDTFCCLGVACEVYKDANPGFEYDGDLGDLENYQEVRRWLGLRSDSGDSFVEDYVVANHQLAYLNDKGLSFKEIADRIRKYPEQYFITEQS